MFRSKLQANPSSTADSAPVRRISIGRIAFMAGAGALGAMFFNGTHASAQAAAAKEFANAKPAAGDILGATGTAILPDDCTTCKAKPWETDKNKNSGNGNGKGKGKDKKGAKEAKVHKGKTVSGSCEITDDQSIAGRVRNVSQECTGSVSENGLTIGGTSKTSNFSGDNPNQALQVDPRVEQVSQRSFFITEDSQILGGNMTVTWGPVLRTTDDQTMAVQPKAGDVVDLMGKTPSWRNGVFSMLFGVKTHVGPTKVNTSFSNDSYDVELMRSNSTVTVTAGTKMVRTPVGNSEGASVGIDGFNRQDTFIGAAKKFGKNTVRIGVDWLSRRFTGPGIRTMETTGSFTSLSASVPIESWTVTFGIGEESLSRRFEHHDVPARNKFTSGTDTALTFGVEKKIGADGSVSFMYTTSVNASNALFGGSFGF